MVVQSFGQLEALLPPQPTWQVAGGALNLYSGYNQTYLEIYRTQPSVRTCVDFLARNVAQLGLPAYRRISDTDRERLPPEHPLVFLIEHPNPTTTRYRLFETVMQDLGIFFNAYLLKVRSSPLALVRLPPDQMTIQGMLWPTGFTWTNESGEVTPFPVSEIVHFGGYGAGLMGLSPLETLRRLLAEEAAAGVYRQQMWTNATRVEGVIERPKDAPKWTPTQKQSWREQWQGAYAAGGSRPGSVAILEDGMQFKQVSYNPRDLEYSAARKLSREEVAAEYHIPPPMVGILEHATFCLPGEAEVFTEDGPKPIADVRAHDQVWSLNDAGAWMLQPVERSACTGYDQILTVQTTNRTLRLNGRHRVLVRRAVDLIAAPIVVMNDGHRRACGRATKAWQSVYVPAAELAVGDTLIALRRLPAAGHEQAPSGRDLTPAFMAVCGLLLGDGNISRKHGQPIGLQFARADHAPYMDEYRQALRAEFHQRGGRPIALIEGARQTRVMSVSAARELDLLGFGGTARTKRVPGWVFHLTEPLRLALLRGFLDADGSVDKKGRISFSSCNPTMLSQVRHLCLSVGVSVTNLRCQRGQTTLPNGRLAAFENWTFTCSDPADNRRIGSHTPVYVARMAAGQPFRRKARRYPWQGGRGFDDTAVQLSAVRSIERSALAVPVYDLAVATTHNFIADGVVVHNSNITEQHKNLYQDTLGPWLELLQSEWERQVVPEFADVARVYVEFNLNEKLKGSFEEQAASLQALVGRPVMTANEGRARLNLSRMDNDPSADQLAAQQGGPSDASVGSPIPPVVPATPRPKPTLMKRTTATEVASVIAAHRVRQADRLQKVPPADRPAAFRADLERWTRELAADLGAISGLSGIDELWFAGLVTAETLAGLEHDAQEITP